MVIAAWKALAYDDDGHITKQEHVDIREALAHFDKAALPVYENETTPEGVDGGLVERLDCFVLSQ